MTTPSTITVTCDICCDEMTNQGSGYACFPCKNFIPSDQLYRYAEHIKVNSKPNEARADDRSF